jgi:hypothetical protein
MLRPHGDDDFATGVPGMSRSTSPGPARRARTLPTERRRELRHPTTGNPVRVREDFRYDLERQLVDGAFVFEERDAATGAVRATVRAPLTLRYVFRWEMEHLLARAGW